jgi:hypothetical protein
VSLCACWDDGNPTNSLEAVQETRDGVHVRHLAAVVGGHVHDGVVPYLGIVSTQLEDDAVLRLHDLPHPTCSKACERPNKNGSSWKHSPWLMGFSRGWYCATASNQAGRSMKPPATALRTAFKRHYEPRRRKRFASPPAHPTTASITLAEQIRAAPEALAQNAVPGEPPLHFGTSHAWITTCTIRDPSAHTSNE